MKLFGLNRRIAFALAFIVPFVVSCSNNGDTNSDTPEINKVNFEDYISENVSVQDKDRIISYLNRPLLELKDDLGTYETSIDSKAFNSDYKYLVTFNHSTLSTVSFSVEVDSWEDDDGYFYYSYDDRDIITGAVINKTGLEVCKNIKIGQTKNEICEANNINRFSDDYFTCDVATGYGAIFTFDDNVLASLTIYNYEGTMYAKESEEELNSNHLFNIIQDAFQYLDTIGNHYDISKMEYFGKHYDKSRGAWFYIWNFGAIESASYSYKNIRVEVDGLHRLVDFGGNVFWKNGKFCAPWEDFVGTFYSRDGNQIEFKSISYNGEFEANLKIDGITIEGVSGVFSDSELGDIANMLGCPYSSRIEYQTEEYSDGYFEYNETNNPLVNRIGIIPSSNTVVYIRNLNNTVAFNRQILKNDIDGSDYSNGYMKEFGRDDPNLQDNTFKMDIDSTSNIGREIINQYMNVSEKTEGLDYVSTYFTYLYDYYYEETNTLYFAWKFYKDDKVFYVDSNNETIIIERYENGLFHHATKRAVWSKGASIKDYFIMFGNWVGTSAVNKKFTATIKENFTLDFSYEGGFISSAENIELNLVDLGTESWSKTIYFTYKNGPFDLCGYFLLNFETWELTVHITRSNLHDFPIGIIELSPESKWTYSDLIDWTDEEIDEREAETGEEFLTGTSVIKDFYGRILGKIEIYSSGKQIGYNFHGKIVGYYYADTDKTTDYSGRVVSSGNTLAALIINSAT